MRTFLKTGLAVAASCLCCLSLAPNAVAVDVSSCDVPQPESRMPGFFSTVMSSLGEGLNSEKYSSHDVAFTLPDGTKMGGLFFGAPGGSNQPLLIATFGMLTSRWGDAAGAFVKLAQAGKIKANVLVLDSPSSAPFYLENGKSISLGGYDEGQHLIQLAKQMQADKLKGKYDFSSISLLGESLSGPGVVYAMLEDARTHQDLFQSAITFNSVVNSQKSIGTYLAYTGHPLQGVSAPDPTFTGKLLVRSAWGGFDSRLKKMDAPATGVSLNKAGDFMYESFSKRLQIEGASVKNGNLAWNPEIKTGSVEAYLASENFEPALSHLRGTGSVLTMVQSQNDEVVLPSDASNIAAEQKENPNLQTVTTPKGGHWGYFSAYGETWVADMINTAIAKSGSRPFSQNCQNRGNVPQSPVANTDTEKNTDGGTATQSGESGRPADRGE